MYNHYDFTTKKNGSIELEDGWYCHRNARGGVRLIPTGKDIASFLARRLAARLAEKFSLVIAVSKLSLH